MSAQANGPANKPHCSDRAAYRTARLTFRFF